MSEIAKSIPPDDNPPEIDIVYRTVVGEYASNLVRDFKMLQHEWSLTEQLASNWLQVANMLMQMNDGPLYVDVEESEDDL